MKSIFLRSVTKVFAVVFALGLSAPAFAQAENPARTAAALADFRRACASYNLSRSDEADFLRFRVDFRPESGGRVWGVPYIKSMIFDMIRDGPSLCGRKLMLQHALHGVPGYDVAGRPSPPVSRPNVPAKSAPKPASKPVISAEEAKFVKDTNEFLKEFKRLTDYYPKRIVPCQWRGAGTGIQSPCMKSNHERGFILSSAALKWAEDNRSRLSERVYREIKTEFTETLNENLKGCAILAGTTTPCALPSKPQLAQKSKIKAGCPADNLLCPPAKGSVVRHIVKLGSQCIEAKLLPAEHYGNIVEVELANKCATAQIIATHVEVAEFPQARLTYVLGPPYFDWQGKSLPAFYFRPIEPHPITMYPGQKTMFQARGGKLITVKTAACDYASPQKIFNRLYTDLTLHGFDQYACVPNPKPPPRQWP